MLYASQPLNQSVTPGVDGEIWLRGRERRARAGAPPSLAKGRRTRPTWEIRRSDERLEGAFKIGKGEGLGRDALQQGGGCFWERVRERGKERRRQKGI